VALDPLDEGPGVPLRDHHHSVELVVGGVLDERREGLEDGHGPLPRHDADVRVLPLVVLGEQLAEAPHPDRPPATLTLAVDQQVDDVASPVAALVLEELEVPYGHAPSDGRPYGAGQR